MSMRRAGIMRHRSSWQPCRFGGPTALRSSTNCLAGRRAFGVEWHQKPLTTLSVSVIPVSMMMYWKLAAYTTTKFNSGDIRYHPIHNHPAEPDVGLKNGRVSGSAYAEGHHGSKNRRGRLCSWSTDAW